MKKIISLLPLLVVALGLFAQTKKYKGNSTSYFDCIYTLDGQIPEFLLAILAGPF